jgi:tetratricopeptide (TPR) repeat protein
MTRRSFRRAAIAAPLVFAFTFAAPATFGRAGGAAFAQSTPAAEAPAAGAPQSIDEIAKLPHHRQKEPLDAFLAKNPTSGEAHFRLGIWYYEEQRMADALESFKKALSVDPNNFKALANAALVLEKTQKREEALALYDTFLKKNPRDARAIAYYGEMLWSMGRKTEGFDQYRKALAIDPACPEAHFNMGAAFASMGIFREAIREWGLVVSGGKPDDLVAQAKNNITRAEGKL